jgi:hypothetical protein
MASHTRNRRPSPRVLRRLLDYDPSTGLLSWKPRPVWMFAGQTTRQKESRAVTWNKRFAGKPAFETIDTQGYKLGRILIAKVMAHRIIMAMTFDAWPEDQVDHINGDRADNRLQNLRSVDAYGNAKNRPLSRRNTSGLLGVRYVKRTNRWHAAITSDGTIYFLGSYPNQEAAVAARAAAEKRFNFHPNHGRKNPCPLTATN